MPTSFRPVSTSRIAESRFWPSGRSQLLVCDFESNFCPTQESHFPQMVLYRQFPILEPEGKIPERLATPPSIGTSRRYPKRNHSAWARKPRAGVAGIASKDDSATDTDELQSLGRSRMDACLLRALGHTQSSQKGRFAFPRRWDLPTGDISGSQTFDALFKRCFGNSYRRASNNNFDFIAKAIGRQDALATLLNTLRVQERQSRVSTAVAIGIVAETCAPFTVLPALMDEYRVPKLNVQNGVLKSLSFLFEYIGEVAKD